MNERENAHKVWRAYEKMPNISMAKASRISGVPYDETRRITEKLIGMDLVEKHFDGYRVTGDFEYDYEGESMVKNILALKVDVDGRLVCLRLIARLDIMD